MKKVLLENIDAGISAWLQESGQPAYRAHQIIEWVMLKRAECFDVMSNLPKGLRHALDADWQIHGMKLLAESPAMDGTKKLLFECSDGKRIESVLMFEGARRTVCISTQVGCGMGCVFCASGLNGLQRNLTSGEILEQVLRARNALGPEDRLSHIVVMGMGESLANLDHLIPALDFICSPMGLGISQRHVTISTVGLAEKMHKLAALDRRYHLAVSLHAATSQLRDELVPVNQKVGLADVMEAADAYFDKTGRQVTFEYVLLGGVNDRREDARALAGLMSARSAHVNLIPYNPVPGLAFQSPSSGSVVDFVRVLRDRGVHTTVRKTKGREIDAACGQLRRRWEEPTVKARAEAISRDQESRTAGSSADLIDTCRPS